MRRNSSSVSRRITLKTARQTSPATTTAMPGSKTVIVDADALIVLIHETDALHRRCLRAATFLEKHRYTSIIPAPVVLEAATVLAKDKMIRRPDLARRLLDDYQDLDPPPTPAGLFRTVATLYQKNASTKNTPFDFFILAMAEILDISLVFSFDSFYRKHGLTLVENLL